jgi:hypothetical protein
MEIPLTALKNKYKYVSKYKYIPVTGRGGI